RVICRRRSLGSSANRNVKSPLPLRRPQSRRSDIVTERARLARAENAKIEKSAKDASPCDLCYIKFRKIIFSNTFLLKKNTFFFDSQKSIRKESVRNQYGFPNGIAGQITELERVVNDRTDQSEPLSHTELASAKARLDRIKVLFESYEELHDELAVLDGAGEENIADFEPIQTRYYNLIGSAALLRDFYVDDFISGANTIEELLILRDEVIGILRKDGFDIRKWASNLDRTLQDLNGRNADVNVPYRQEENGADDTRT
ncbi:unnamed protein product, partial [Trichogramma brassicae]